jgi:hypothetical protein
MAHPGTWDDIGVFCWLVKTTLGTAKAAPAGGDGGSPGGGLE